MVQMVNTILRLLSIFLALIELRAVWIIAAAVIGSLILCGADP